MLSIDRCTQLRPSRVQLSSLLLLSAVAMLLSGCGNFFSCEGKADCPATGSTGSTGSTGATASTGSTSVDYAYVANSASGSTYANGYSLSSGALTAITGSPFSLGFTPTAAVVTPANTFVYMATDAALNSNMGYLYGYSIGTGGALSILSSGTALASENITALAVSPDGQWLFCLDDDPGTETLEEYGINSSTGALTYETTYGVSGAANATIIPTSVTVAPSGDYVAIALGTAGVETFTFDTTSGVATANTVITPANAATGIYAVAADANDYLYAAGTAGLQVFSATTAGTPTLLNTYTTGNGARSLAINSTSTCVYVGNETDSTISGYSIGTDAALTALSGSPYTAPTSINSLAIDSSGANLIASGYNATSGIQLYAIGATGGLTASASAASGTSTFALGVSAPVAATH